MSLSEYSDGLLRSHVTWSDVEQAMQEALETETVFGPAKTVKNIGEANGYLSRMCLVEADWQGENLPNKFVVKVCSQLTARELSAGNKNFMSEELLEQMDIFARKAHNVEVSAYEIIQKYDTENKIVRPKVYAMQKFTETNSVKGYIIMEFMDDLEQIHLVDNLQPDDIREVLKSVATLEAIGLKTTEEEKKSVFNNLFHDHWLQAMPQKTALSYISRLRKVLDSDMEEHIVKLEKMTEVVFSAEYFKKLDAFSDEMGMKSVLVHFDLWSTNILWSKVDEEYKLRAIIDFQVVNVGSPGADLCRLIFSNLSGKDRREHFDTLTEDFYSYLREEVEGEMPYTLDQLKRSCSRFFVFCGFIIAMFAFPLSEVSFNQKGQDGEEVEKKKERLMEKTKALVEDMISHYDAGLDR